MEVAKPSRGDPAVCHSLDQGAPEAWQWVKTGGVGGRVREHWQPCEQTLRRDLGKTSQKSVWHRGDGHQVSSTYTHAHVSSVPACATSSRSGDSKSAGGF